MTERLTKVNAVRAPKLTKSTAESRLINTAEREMIETNTMFATGVLYFGRIVVNNFFGRIDSRPRAKRKRLTLVTEETPCVNVATISTMINSELNKFPPTSFTRL